MERQRRLPWRKCRPREKGAAPTLHLPAETILLSLNCLREGNAIRLHLSDQLSIPLAGGQTNYRKWPAQGVRAGVRQPHCGAFTGLGLAHCAHISHARSIAHRYTLLLQLDDP
jgi:hypothetical protein